MNAILTGSQKYGKPTLRSDVDLVILVSEGDLLILKALGKVTEPEKGSDSDPGTAGFDDGLTASIRFGDLNLICVTDPIAFAVWQKGTKQLSAERPVTKQRAVDHFRELRVKHGLSDRGPDKKDDVKWQIGDPVHFPSDGRRIFGLITQIHFGRRTVTVSYKGHDYYEVKMTALTKAEMTDGYRAAKPGDRDGT